MMILKEFSRIVCVSLFSYQGSLLVRLTDSLFTLPHLTDCVKYFFEVFYFFKIQNLKRRRRDLNPRAAINDLLPFQGSPFGQLGYFSKLPYAIASHFFQKRFILYRVVFRLSRTFLNYFHSQQRREWDSNPRALADKRFSRPPRYDHFDISPYTLFSVRHVSVRRKMYSIIKSF